MREVFADSGYWIAMWDVRDALHLRAQAVTARLGSIPIVTTQLVLVETLDAMSRLGEFRRRYAAQAVRDLEQNPQIEIVPQTSEQFWAALERYAGRADQSWSLTDCASFVLMEQRGVTDALAYDRDFEQAGFAPLLREGEA